MVFGDSVPNRLLPRQPFLRSTVHGEADVADVGRQNLLQLIQLRWLAVTGQLITIAFVQWGLQIHLPLSEMAAVLVLLLAFNLLSFFRLRLLPRSAVGNFELMASLLLDVLALTALLYLSGGATNPFIFLYPLQVTLAAVLLKAWSQWTVVAVTIACFVVLMHWYVPLHLPTNRAGDLLSLHILGMLICFMLDAVLLAVFVSRINRNLRKRDARLAALRQRAAEEDHIVRMGLLASGAAHELGTPLATLSVILGDWQRMPVFAEDPLLRQELTEMQTEVKRCKSIVTGILLSAGEARGEAPAKTTLKRFLSDLVDGWRATRGVARFEYRDRIANDATIISDPVLKQILCNVLDNAADASPHWVGFTATLEDGTLTLQIHDRGPGFAEEMLDHFGKPYQSSKGRPGGGLGLFLVVNVVRKLGGRVSAANRPEGGASVTLELPIEALAIEGGADGHGS